MSDGAPASRITSRHRLSRYATGCGTLVATTAGEGGTVVLRDVPDVNEVQQAVSELALDLAGPASLASRADDGSPQEGWARRSAPTYLNLRKASIYGGSNEIQRQIISRTILGL